MTPEPSFVVLLEEKPGLWREIGRVPGKDRRDALLHVFDGEPPAEDVVVVSVQAFKPGKVVPVQVYDLEPATP